MADGAGAIDADEPGGKGHNALMQFVFFNGQR